MSKFRYSTQSKSGGAAKVVVHALGQFRVVARGNPLHLQSRASKPLQFLKVLVALGTASVSVEQLSESLWPDSDGDRAYGVFSITLRRLRELIGHDSVILRNGRVSLDPEKCWVDAIQFAEHASKFGKALHDKNLAAADDHFSSALDLYKGPFLPGEYEPGEVLSARTQLHAVFLRSVQSYGDHLRSAGDADKATSVYERGLEVDDNAEVLYQRLMRCYLSQGRFNDCVNLYHRCSDLLRATSGVKPSSETEALYQEAINAPKDSSPSPSSSPSQTDGVAPKQTSSGIQPASHRSQPAPGRIWREEKRVATLACFRFHIPTTPTDPDPEAFRELLEKVHSTATSVVSGHRGELVQLAGNAVFSAFGLQLSSENDAERAVRAAISLRDQMLGSPLVSPDGSRVGVSVGIATGAFTVDAIAGNIDNLSAIVGAPANRAADLAALARGYQVFADQQTWHSVRGYFTGTAIHPESNGDNNSHIAAIEIHKSVVHGSRFEAAIHRGLSPFLAREWELETLHLCFDLAQNGQGQLVSVIGDPGIGKSRLVYEFRRSIGEDGALILEGKCQSIGIGVPYLPIQEILRSGLGIESSQASTPDSIGLAERILGLSKRLEQYLPHLLHLMSAGSERYRMPDSLQGTARRHELQDAFAEFICELARRGPLVLVCEDWHWADEASDAALYSLVARMSQVPLLVVVAYRSEYRPTWTRFEYHRPLMMRPLDSVHSSRLLRSILKDAQIPEGFDETIHARTQGNALFIEELAQSLVDGELTDVASRTPLNLAATALTRIPQSIHAVIRARIDRLDPEDRDILRICSAIGPTFNLSVVEQLASPEPGALSHPLERLVQLDFVRPLRLSTGAEYQFKHVLTHEVVYDTLLLSQRRELHGKIGKSIETLYPNQLESHCEQLAHHYSCSDNASKAARYLEMSGDKAVRQTALEAARQNYEKALALVSADLSEKAFAAHAIDLTHKLASVSEYAPSTRLIEALNSARESAAKLNDDVRLAQTIYWMGRVHYILGHLADALTYFDSAMRVAQQVGETALHAQCLSAMGRTCVYTAEHERGINYLLRSLEIMTRIGNTDEVSYSSHVLGLHYGMIGDFEKAFAYGEEGLRIAIEGRMISRQPMAQNQLAWLQGMHGDFAGGLRTINGSRELTRKAGDTYSTGIGSIVEGWLRFMSGDQVAGIRLMSKGIEVVKTAGSNMALTQWHAVIAEALALVGDIEEARENAQQALAIASTGQHHGESIALRALAIAASRDSDADPTTVDRFMEESLELAGRFHERPYAAVTRLRYSELLLKRGDTDQALEQSNLARAEFENMHMNGWLPLLLC